ncbi:unnamed protein product, partial [Effrenium voratum]
AAGRLLPEVLRGGQAVGQALPSRGRRLPLRRGRPRRASALHGPRGVPKAQQAHPGGAERPADGRRGRRAGGSKGPRRPAPLCRFLASPLVTRARPSSGSWPACRQTRANAWSQTPPWQPASCGPRGTSGSNEVQRSWIGASQ